MKSLEEHGEKLRFDSKLNEWVAKKEFYTKEGQNFNHDARISLWLFQGENWLEKGKKWENKLGERWWDIGLSEMVKIEIKGWI